jgi:acetyl-CoA acetyltransferase family protein
MAMTLAREIWIVGAKRTAFGAFGGTLKDLTATDLAVEAAKGALAQANADPATVEQVVFGNVQQTSADSIYLARHVGLRVGAPVAAAAVTVNRLCGSGFQALINGAEQILLGESEVVLTGGTESMSQAPHVVRGARWGLAFGKEQKLGDTLWDALTDSYTGMPMAITAENLAEQYKISRQECDAYALRSQTAWATANEAGRFKDEIVAIEVKSPKSRAAGPVKFATDEHPRPQTTMEALAKLPPIFKKDGVVTAGNASGISDGAGALLLCSKEAGQKYGWKPLAKLTQWAFTGCDPKIMGIGPAPAIRQAMGRIGKKLSDFDLVEVNEAFAPQYLAVEKELGLDRERTNVDGGAIALGHPLGASGARITAHLVHELRRRGKKLAIGSACIGGGQGIAVVIEAAQ